MRLRLSAAGQLFLPGFGPRAGAAGASAVLSAARRADVCSAAFLEVAFARQVARLRADSGPAVPFRLPRSGAARAD